MGLNQGNKYPQLPEGWAAPLGTPRVGRAVSDLYLGRQSLLLLPEVCSWCAWQLPVAWIQCSSISCHEQGNGGQLGSGCHLWEMAVGSCELLWVFGQVPGSCGKCCCWWAIYHTLWNQSLINSNDYFLQLPNNITCELLLPQHEKQILGWEEEFSGISYFSFEVNRYSWSLCKTVVKKSAYHWNEATPNQSLWRKTHPLLLFL